MSEQRHPHDGSCINGAGAHHHQQQQQCACLQTSTVAQGLDELEFERGIWTAALDNDTKRLCKRISRGETNRRDNFGYTALHYAARHRHADACRLLLAAGADVNAQTTAGAVTALHRAATAGAVEIVRLLLVHGARIQLADDDGNSALHRAAAAGHAEICAILCDRNNDTLSKELKNKRGQCAADLVPTERRAEFRSVFEFAISDA